MSYKELFQHLKRASGMSDVEEEKPVEEYETVEIALNENLTMADATMSKVQAWGNRVFIKGSPEIGAYVWKKWKQRDALIGYSYIRVGLVVQVWRFERRNKSAIITITHCYNVKQSVYAARKDDLILPVINKDAIDTKRRLSYGETV